MKKPIDDKLGALRLAIAVFFAAMAGAPLQAAQSTWQGVGNNTNGINWSVSTNWAGNTVPASGNDIIIADSPNTNILILDDAPHAIGLLQLGTNGMKTSGFTIRAFTNDPTASHPLTINSGILTSNTGVTFQAPVVTVGNQIWRVNAAANTASPGNANQGIVVSQLGSTVTTNSNSTNTLTLGGTLTKVGLGNLSFFNSLTVLGGYDIIVQEGSLSVFNNNSIALGYAPMVISGPGNIVVSNNAKFIFSSASPAQDLFINRNITFSNNATFMFGSTSGGRGYFTAPINWNGNFGGSANMTFSCIGLLGGTLVISNAPWSGSATVNLNSVSGPTLPYHLQFVNVDNSSFTGKLIHNGYPGTSMCTVQFWTNSSGSPNAEWSLVNNQSSFEFTNGATSVQFGALSGNNGLLRNQNNGGVGATAIVGGLGTSTGFGANITDGQAPLSLVKIGNGAWSLSGTNDFTGGFVISNGTVNAQPADSNTPGLGSGPVSIMTNATLLAYGNSINCAVTNYGGGTVGCPGNGTWSLGSLVLGTTSSDVTSNQFEVDLGAKMIVTNNNNSLTVNGTSIVNVFGAAPAVGVYDLIQYRGTVQGSPAATGFNGFQLGSLPVGCTANLQIFTGPSYSALQLNVIATTVHPVRWVGNVNTNWDTSGVLNWKDLFNGSTQAFTNMFDTVFNDSASNFVVNVSNVQPASVTISNNAHTYTFGGSGTISGIGYLWKDGPGTAILVNSNNTFSGGTFVTNGVLQIGNGGTNGVLPGDPQGVDVEANGTLAFNRSDIVSYSGQITGAGTVEQLGLGTLTLTGDNSFWTGPLLVYGGTFKAGIGGTASFGAPSSPVIVSNGATLDMNDYSLRTKPVTLGGNGALINSDASNQNKNMVRFIDMNGPATIGGNGSWWVITTNTANNAYDPSVAGIDVYLHGNGYPLTKIGSGEVDLYNVGDTGLGDITVAKGTLTFSFLSKLGIAANNLVIYPGAQVTFAAVSANNQNPPPLQKNLIMTNATLECIDTKAKFIGNITLVGNNSFAVIHNSSPAPLTLNSSVTGSGILTKTGTEPLILSPSFSALHTGGTVISAGPFQVDGTLGAGGATVAVTNAGTLCGLGVIQDAVIVQSGGTVAPGQVLGLNSIATLTINNSATMLPGSTNLLEVNKDSVANDLLDVSGSLTYAGTLAVANQTLTPFAVGDSFKLFNAGSYSGTFQNINPSVPGAGMVWKTNNLTVNGTLEIVEAPPTLTNLVIFPAGTLYPTFADTNLSYTATNAYLSNPVTVTAYAADPGSTLQLSFNGGAFGPLTNGVASPAKTLLLPTNTVAVKVTSADALANQTYTVNVTLQPNLAQAKLTNSVSGNTMTLTWPADHLGWRLQMQTNTLGAGLKTNGWVNIPGTDLVTQTNISLTKTNPSVFFRMTYP